MEQRSPEWYAIRAGKLTGSRIADAFATIKSGWGASRATYQAQLVSERLTGKPQENGFVSKEMQWGIDTEAEARAAYSFFVGHDVVDCAFLEHPTIPMAGCSPDGLVSGDGVLELKCPLTSTHISTLLGGSIPGRYVLQMQWAMACGGPERRWCDFVSYDPRLPPSMALFCKRLPRDHSVIEDLEAQARVFLREVEDTVARLKAAYP